MQIWMNKNVKFCQARPNLGYAWCGCAKSGSRIGRMRGLGIRLGAGGGLEMDVE